MHWCCRLTSRHGHRDGAGTSFSPHMGYDPAGPLCLPPSVPQQAVHVASVSPTQHDTKLQSAASALTAQAHVFLLSWTQAGRKREEGRGYKWGEERTQRRKRESRWAVHFFMVGFNYKQPAWWGGYGHSTFRGSLKQHLFRVRKSFNDLLHLFGTSLPPSLSSSVWLSDL